MSVSEQGSDALRSGTRSSASERRSGEEDVPASDAEDEERGVDPEENLNESEFAAGDDAEVMDLNGIYNARDVNDQVFEELNLGDELSRSVQETWRIFLGMSDSREAAGEVVYAALFDAAPSLQSLFKTPRAVMAMRFTSGLNNIIQALGSPAQLKVVVETLGFQHLDLEVTVPRVAIFRDAICELIQVELGDRLDTATLLGWRTFLNYVGGSYIFVRMKFAARLRILTSSWATANNKAAELALDADDSEKSGSGSGNGSGDKREKRGSQEQKGSFNFMGRKGGNKGEGKSGEHESSGEDAVANTMVPTTYREMFQFNAAVMGFGNCSWMREVLASFDTIVTNVANSYRLQEECDVLALRIAKHSGKIDLPQYKAVMLASLRSLVPKDWNSEHEVAWSWLWENVERMIAALMGKPHVQMKALEKLWAQLDTQAQQMVRREVYAKFFSLAPTGQDYFKQSTTRLHFIADRVVAMTLEIYKEPQKMVEDISALGLRHVGYGIPTELFGPFVTACVQVVCTLTNEEVAVEAFRWALNLISRILTRVINEGSTIVMKAINANSGRQLKKAVNCAPRGARADWTLRIQVGTKSISPLLWAIETGSLEAARAIIVDLLTIRADRDRYYYGMDTMFDRHPDIVRRLCVDAPALLPVLLDGLIWRSRTVENGQRRVNYYVKHLIADGEGHFAKALEWIVDLKDAKIVCHPVIALVTDTVWRGIAFRTFMFLRSWFLLTLLIFVFSQSISTRLHTSDTDDELDMHHSRSVNITIMVCRCFIYVFSMGKLMHFHGVNLIRDMRSKDFWRLNDIVPVPTYLHSTQNVTSLLLTILLVLMLCFEPILHCAGHDEGDLFTEACKEAETHRELYSCLSTISILFYFLLLTDLSVFSTRVSAFVLVMSRLVSEVVLYIFALLFFTVAWACGVAALDHEDKDFDSIQQGALSLVRLVFGMFSAHHYEVLMHEPVLMTAVLVYVMLAVVFLSNLLIAQLSCSYAETYEDMVGFARLNRGHIVVQVMANVPAHRWKRFIGQLHLDERKEFGEGDIGLAGCVQTLEPAALNPTTVDMIRRFGGSTSPQAQWPEEAQDMDKDRIESIENKLTKAMKRLTSSKRKKGSRSGATGGSSQSGSYFSSQASQSQGPGGAEKSGGSQGGGDSSRE